MSEDKSQQQFVDELTQVLSQAENVGETTARKIARRTAKETNNMATALKLIATDERFQEDLKDIGGVGAKTIGNVVKLASAIVSGSLTIVADTFDVLRVVSEDFLKARQDDVEEITDGGSDGMADKDSKQNQTDVTGGQG